jgi:hypothetical protein
VRNSRWTRGTVGNLRQSIANNHNNWEVHSANNDTTYQERMQIVINSNSTHSSGLSQTGAPEENSRNDYLRNIERTFYERSAAHIPRNRNMLLNSYRHFEEC